MSITLFSTLGAAVTFLSIGGAPIQPAPYAQKQSQPNYFAQYSPPLASAPSAQLSAAEKVVLPAGNLPQVYFHLNGQKQIVKASYAKTSTANTQRKDDTSWTSYVVKQDDTAHSLARKLCSRASEILKYNRLNSDYSLQAGQAILLPPANC